MQELGTITNEQKNFAIDLLVSLVSEELADKLNIDSSKALAQFVVSNTGQLLYDESSKLWWSGPSYIVEMYLNECGIKGDE